MGPENVLKYNYAWSKYYDESQRYPLGFVEDLYTQQEYYGSIATRFKPAKSGIDICAGPVLQHSGCINSNAHFPKG